MRTDQAVYLEKCCPTHGASRQHLSDSPDYWAGLDRFYFKVNRRSYPQRDFIVRMTERCNLDCPICLAKANTENTPDLDLAGLERLLTARRGIKIDLMAAEPTLRDDLEDWVRRVKASGNIAALHTNGIRLADPAFARRMAAAGVDEVFLQFDGFDETAHVQLRGRPLLNTRLQALANLREVGIATSLIVVVARGLNEAEIGKTFRFALAPGNEHIREVFFLGLRLMGSARDALVTGQPQLFDQQLMPDELLSRLCQQEPRIRRADVYDFNRLYFALLSAFEVKKCLYVQHYLVLREPGGGFRPCSDVLDLAALGRAAERYAQTFSDSPRRAQLRLLAALAREGLKLRALEVAGDFLRLERLFETGMNLTRVPPRFLLIGFITACDPYNFDEQVAENCGKGELSVDGGFTESSARANVAREVRFEQSARRPPRATRSLSG